MFTKAIVRKPGRSMVNGITNANLGKPNYDLALYQHDQYVRALEVCGLDVKVLPPDEKYPDSCFVEDTALLTPYCGIICNPGAASRKGEIMDMREVVEEYYKDIDEINEPGTVEAGDIMMVGNHYYLGLSGRTNFRGANQVIDLLKRYGMTGSTVKLENVLHLKTGLSYLENNKLLVSGEFLNSPVLKSFNVIEVSDEEAYAANCIWVNGKVLVPAGHPITAGKIIAAGYEIIELDMSEFQKLDGGLSCLSLRF